MSTTIPPGSTPESHSGNPPVTDRRPGQCPSWCRADHAKHDLHSRYTWGDGPDEVAWRSSHHSVDVAVIDNPGAGPPVYVMVKATDDLPDPDGIPTIEEPNAGPTTIDLAGAECMEPHTAVEVAAATLEAVRVAEGRLPAGDVTDRELVASLDRRLSAYCRLVDDLQGAMAQYGTAVPLTHLRLILGRFRERIGGKR